MPYSRKIVTTGFDRAESVAAQMTRNVIGEALVYVGDNEANAGTTAAVYEPLRFSIKARRLKGLRGKK